MYFVVQDETVIDSLSVEKLQQSEIATVLDIQIPDTTRKYIGADWHSRTMFITIENYVVLLQTVTNC